MHTFSRKVRKDRSRNLVSLFHCLVWLRGLDSN